MTCKVWNVGKHEGNNIINIKDRKNKKYKKIENKENPKIIKTINVISSKVDKQVFFWCYRQNKRWGNTKKLFTKLKKLNSYGKFK